jgi:tRNA wybutosine-synthesizing protein 1
VIEANKLMNKLGGKYILPASLGDDQTNLDAKFLKWTSAIEDWLSQELIKINLQIEEHNKAAVAVTAVAPAQHSCDCGNSSTNNNEGCCSTGGGAHPNDDEVKDDEDYIDEEDEDEEDRINAQYVDDYTDDDPKKSFTFKGIEDDEPVDGSLIDLEDLGRSKQAQALQQSMTAPPREMVTKLQRQALTKEGYKIIGSHSAVKLCRWTKHQMRGRGGCYKHTFYGITSYQCMEATPSLACANKCVFCWRHHKNPVGTEWRWKEDDPGEIVDEAVRLHQGLINQMRGVPGVLPERLKEAMTVKHCALSLVGEPIMYPRINEFLRHLHQRKISSFLVTNAQFPDRIQQLDPVTQLYVSVDAATKDSLKTIDRPLFKDFWDRFLASLTAMKDKQQRTVYRLTLVKSWNMNEIDEYISLIELGKPDFIEIKAVTYCGKSDASTLTMEHVPWHREVCAFAEIMVERLRLCKEAVPYSIATEHEHSCCILLAREDKFLVNNHWHTWIDYDKYQQLIQAYYDSNGEKTFTSVDYIAPTPEWAIYKHEAKGFDPKDKRYRKTKAGSITEIPYQPSESGCG